MKDQITFDLTSTDTIADSDKIIAFLRDEASGNNMSINASSELLVKDGDVETAVQAVTTALGGTLTVDQATGSEIQITDGTDTLGVNADGSINVAVTSLTATDLDIRTLQHDFDANGDSVRLGDGTGFISSGDGSADDLATSFRAFDSRSFGYAFDGTTWDRLRSTNGALNVDIQDASITVEDVTLADTAIKNVAEVVTGTVGQIVDGADELASRKYLYLYNNGNRKVYVGESGVSASTGFPMSPKSYMEFRIGSSVDVYMIAAGGSQDVRTMQLS